MKCDNIVSHNYLLKNNQTFYIMKKYFLFAVAAMFLVACNNDNDDVDTTKPVIEIIKPVADAGEDHIEFHQGDEFEFEAKFTDNVALKSYKVAIHYNGDGHEHSAVVKSATEEDHVEWDQEWSGDLKEEQEDRVAFLIEVPENAEPGEYHLGVYCFDVAGNESTTWMEIVVEEEGHDH